MEFALVLPVIVLLIFGLFDAGRLVIDYSTLTNASRAGARVAMVNQSNVSTGCSTVRTFKCAAAEHSGSMGIAPASIDDVDIDGADCAVRFDCEVTVTVDHDFQMITPVISAIIGPLHLESTTTMPMERAYIDP